MKDARIVEQNSTIKSQKTKINNLQKSLSRLESKFNEFQRQSVSNLANIEPKKELMEMKDKKRERVQK